MSKEITMGPLLWQTNKTPDSHSGQTRSRWEQEFARQQDSAMDVVHHENQARTGSQSQLPSRIEQVTQTTLPEMTQLGDKTAKSPLQDKAINNAIKARPHRSGSSMTSVSPHNTIGAGANSAERMSALAKSAVKPSAQSARAIEQWSKAASLQTSRVFIDGNKVQLSVRVSAAMLRDKITLIKQAVDTLASLGLELVLLKINGEAVLDKQAVSQSIHQIGENPQGEYYGS